MNPNDTIISAFIDESGELLNQLEGLLLDLEDDPTNRENLDAVFRVMHTIKGSAGMVGFEVINQFTHQIEDAFDKIRKGESDFTEKAADLTLQSRDIITTLLNNNESVDETLQIQMDYVVNSLKNSEIIEDDSSSANENKDNSENSEKTFRIVIKPSPEIFLRGINPLNLILELSTKGLSTVTANFEKVPSLSELKVEECFFSWDILIHTDESKEGLLEIFQFIEADSNIMIEELQKGENPDSPRLGEILKQRGLIEQEDLERALKSQRRIGEVLVDENVVSPAQLESALNQQKHLMEVQKKNKAVATNSIRVSTEKLDMFVDLVGELVTLQARLSQIAHKSEDRELETVSEGLNQLMEDLRDTALGIRMIPIGESFSSFRRLVRDLSKDLNKEIILEIEGGETELDKTVIDRLHDPLLHVIRNSIDHGIESPEERGIAGKQAHGVITLSAQHSGGNVIITIEDDGSGLNKDKLLKKAIDRGLVSSDIGLRDEDIYKFIFHSGFSTADKISKVSGRGVGMDVVKKEIDALGGHINIKSEQGKYTKIIFTLPLTLAIIDGLLVQIDNDHYVIPLAAVESCMELTAEMKEKSTNSDGDLIYYRDSLMPYIKMRDFLNYEGEIPEREQLVVLRTEDTVYGVVVDQVIGDHQTVIKNLGKVFKKAKGFSGATILGSGEVALILNVTIIANMYKEQKELANSAGSK